VWGKDKAIMKCPSQFIESAFRDLCKSDLQLTDISLMTSRSGDCRTAKQAKLQHRNGGKVLTEFALKFITYSLTIY
jgi:hypothetical protein